MRQLVPLVVFTAILVAAIGLSWWHLRGPESTVPVAPVVEPLADPRDMATEALWTAAEGQPDCRLALDVWWELALRRPDEVEPWRAIAECKREGDGIDRVVDEAASAFEQSRFLGVIPWLLDLVSLRSVVPILNRVHTDRNQAASDMYDLGRQLRDAGDVAGSTKAFRQALSLDPGDSETGLAYGYSLIQTGDLEGARSVLRRAVLQDGFKLRLDRLYAFGVVWPVPFLGFVVALVGIAITVFTKLREESPWALLAAVTFTLLALGVYFAYSGDRIAFLMLCTFGGGAGAWLILEPIRRFVVKWFGAGAQMAAEVISGELHRRLRALPQWITGGILVLAVGLLVVGVPFVPNMDARIALLCVIGFVIVSTVGALLSPWLERVKTLRAALSGLGLAGTLPFLFFLLYVERESLLNMVLERRWMDHGETDRLTASLLVWALGVVASLILARILASGLLEPLDRITEAVARVRAGDYGARAGLLRHDEIGALGSAVDEMAARLEGRQQVEDRVRRFVNPDVAERLISGDPSLLRGKRVDATVLVASLEGVERDVDADTVLDMLNESFTRLAPVIHRWGGTVDRILGDGLIALWGVQGKEDVPANAVRAGMEMIEAINAFNDELAMRGRPLLRLGVAIDRGNLVAGPIGSPERQEYAVFGEALDNARRAVDTGSDVILSPSVKLLVEHEFSVVAMETGGFFEVEGPNPR